MSETVSDLFETKNEQTNLFDVPSNPAYNEPAARIRRIDGRPRPDWMADDARAAITACKGEPSRSIEREIARLRLFYLKHATCKITTLVGRLGWPALKASQFCALQKWDVDTAFGFLVHLHTKTNFVPDDPFTFGCHRAQWCAGQARLRLSPLFEGDHLPKHIEEKIHTLAEMYIGSVQISSSWLSRKMGWSNSNRFRARVGRSRLMSRSCKNMPLDVNEAFELLCASYEQGDAMQWNRRGDTVRNVRKRSNRLAREASEEEVSVEVTPSSYRCGVKMQELLDAGEDFFFRSTGAPAYAPMSDEVRREFDAMCQVETDDHCTGEDTVTVEMTDAPEQGWYHVEWHPRFAVISLYVQAEASTPKIVDWWIRDIGTKSRQILLNRLKVQLWDFVTEDAEFTI